MTTPTATDLRRIAEALGWNPGPDQEVAYKCSIPDKPPSILTDKALWPAAEEYLVERGWSIHIDQGLYEAIAENEDVISGDMSLRGHALRGAMLKELGI